MGRKSPLLAYNPPRWLRAGHAYRCEGADSHAPSYAHGHRDIRRGEWLLRRPHDTEEGVVWFRSCAACGLSWLIAQSHAPLLEPMLSRIRALRNELRDQYRCFGERRLLVALLERSLDDLENGWPDARRWFELEDWGAISFRDVAAHLGLEAVMVGPEKSTGPLTRPFEAGVARRRATNFQTKKILRATATRGRS